MNREVLRKMLGSGKRLTIGQLYMIWVELDHTGARIEIKDEVMNLDSHPFPTIQEAIEEAINIIVKRADDDLYTILRRAHELGYEQEDLIHLVKSVDVEKIMDS